MLLVNKELQRAVLASILLHVSVLWLFSGGKSLGRQGTAETTLAILPPRLISVTLPERPQPWERHLRMERGLGAASVADPDTPVELTPTDHAAQLGDAAPPAPATGLIPTYFPATQLTQRPYPVDPIMLDYPEALSDYDPLSVVARIMIDEFGNVDHVVFEGIGIPKEYRNAVETAFKPARFEPGELNGQAVKSQLRVEITFGAPALNTGR